MPAGAPCRLALARAGGGDPLPDDPFEDGIAHEEMKPIPPMLASIILAFVAALAACHLAWISDLVTITIVLALLVVLVATDSEPGFPYPAPRRETFSMFSRLFHR
jgi:hypothetical protein